MAEAIVRIAARGDGVTATGRHAPFGVPGDQLFEDGTLKPGPHHRIPPCRHFPVCGGCQLQHVDDEEYRNYLVSRVTTALEQHGLSTEVIEPHLSPPRTRRRASLRALKIGQGAVLGFNEARSNRVVDMLECHILRPELFALVAPLRALLASLLQPRKSGEAQMTLVDQGVDVLLTGVEPEGYDVMEGLTAFCMAHQLARLSIDRGMGPETLYEPESATIRISGIAVSFPVAGFLQATEDGEAILVNSVRRAINDSQRTADLFSGLGTFALSLPGKVYAAEAFRDAVLALKKACARIAVEHRDLYRRPLDTNDLKNFDAVVIDPPRAGAEQQAIALAASSVQKLAYVSCNPATFARDAKLLTDGGYKLEWVRPVGQFRWSTHVELAAAFSR